MTVWSCDSTGVDLEKSPCRCMNSPSSKECQSGINSEAVVGYVQCSSSRVVSSASPLLKPLLKASVFHLSHVPYTRPSKWHNHLISYSVQMPSSNNYLLQQTARKWIPSPWAVIKEVILEQFEIKQIGSGSGAPVWLRASWRRVD